MFRFASSKVQPVQKKTVATLVVLTVIFNPIEDIPFQKRPLIPCMYLVRIVIVLPSFGKLY
jgi:hypothetical protein